MTHGFSAFRSIVQEEQDRRRFPELALVTQVFPKSSDGGKENHQVGIKLVSSDVELLRAQVAVGRLGLAALPRVGDVVVVIFVNGDLNAPIVIGSVYDHQQHPPKAEADEVVYQVPDDAASGTRRIHLETPSGATITLDDDTLKIAMGDTTVEVKKDGNVEIKSASSVSINSSSDFSLEAQGNISIKAQGKLELSGMTLTAEGQGTATVKAPSLSLAGVTQFSPS